MKTTLFTSLLLLLGSAGTASGTVISFVSPGPVVAGNTFTVDVNADDSAGIGGFLFDVNFDPTIVNAVDAVGLGDFDNYDYSYIDNTGGVISGLFGLTTGDTIDSGDGIPLAELTFSAIASGDVTLSFGNELIITDPDTFATEDNPTFNTLDITVANAPEPATWTMLLTAGAFALLKRASFVIARKRSKPE